MTASLAGPFVGSLRLDGPFGNLPHSESHRDPRGRRREEEVEEAERDALRGLI